MRNINGEDEIEDNDDVAGQDEFAGFSVTDDSGNEVLRPVKKKAKKEESYDDGETVEATPIPPDEQTVIIDNADTGGLELGAALTLVLEDGNGCIMDKGCNVGDLKPAYIAKLKETRSGQFAACTLHSVAPRAMVKLKFYTDSKKDTIKI